MMRNIAHIGFIDTGSALSSMLAHVAHAEERGIVIAQQPLKVVNTYKDLPLIETPMNTQRRFKGPHTMPLVRQTPKVSRNAECSCGSGKKNKRCCNTN